MNSIKKIVSILIVGVFLALSVYILSINVVAEESSSVIKSGTPTIDGQVDDIYKTSLKIQAGTGTNALGGAWDDAMGDIYFLYDANYLYICADITDNDVFSKGELYVQNYNPWQNDCCEFRLSLDGGTTTIKVGIDAFGYRVYGLEADMEKIDYSKILYKTTCVEEGLETGYIIEVAIPCTGEYLDMITADKLGFKLQLNDLDRDGNVYSFATDYAGEGAKGLVYYNLSGDVTSKVIDYKELSFASDGNYFINNTQDNFGSQTVNAEAGTVDIGYGATNYKNAFPNDTADTSYMAKVAFNTAAVYDKEYKYLRVLYSAQNPEGVDSTEMRLWRDGKTDSSAVVSFTNPIVNTNGEFVLSDTVQITDEMADRWVQKNVHNSLMFMTTAEGGVYQIKSFYFFETEEDANEFVYTSTEKPEAPPNLADYKELCFSQGGNYYILSGENYGSQTMNAEAGTVDISCGSTNYKKAFPNDTADTSYMAKVAFNAAAVFDKEYKYLRVLYSAQNPEGVDSTEMRLWRDGKNDSTAIVSFTNPIVNTNGEFVLSDTVQITDEMADRWVQKNVHNSLMFMTTAEGGVYQIKSFYLFKSADEANNFVVPSNEKEIKINGIDISEFQIVLSEDPVSTARNSAEMIKRAIREMTGKDIPIVDDSVSPTDYEILIGNTNRPENLNYYGQGCIFNPTSKNYSIAQYQINRVGNKLLLLASTAQGIDDVANMFVMKLRNSDSNVDITESSYGKGMISVSRVVMSEVTNVEEPFNFKDDFNEDKGYWTTDSDKTSWEFVNENTNNLLSSGSDFALSYLHVFEKNVSFEADMKFTSSDNGTMGMMLRYTSDHAYVKVGYNFRAKEWFIDTREGEDYIPYRIASKTAEITADKWYELKTVIDGNTVTLYVDGEEILSTSSLTQLTPGKIGVFSKGVSVKLDNVDIDLLSGQGTIIRNVVHTKLPDEEYREGGTVWEMNDGSLIYESSSGATFVSDNSGKLWERAEKWTETYGYPNILRLDNGDFLKIATETISGVQMKTAQISTNEGETWTTVGNICTGLYQGNSTVKAGNMNDKLTQMSDGRIFYSQNYQASTAFTDKPSQVGDGTVQVFCEIYYSDDNGCTWTMSETLSYEIPGNTDGGYFGECKVLETAEGKLRIYNSWNTYGCIVYSESSDNGITWGPLQKMEDFKCVVSSMQFVKDDYADNNTTYYMVWVNTGEELITGMNTMPRSRLTLAKSTDGINWKVLGDIWRWESRYSNDGAQLYHIVNPFIKVTDDYLIVGSGFSEKSGDTYHQAQRQHIYSILKNTLEELEIGDDTSSSIEVEINNVGEETSGVTITAPTSGWVEGINTFTVSSDDACVVAVKNADGSYSRVVATATDEASAYKYTVEDMTAETEIVVALSGDTNGDGKVSNADITKLRAACAGKATLDGIQTLLGDVNGNGKVTNADITRLRAACAGKLPLNW